MPGYIKDLLHTQLLGTPRCHLRGPCSYHDHTLLVMRLVVPTTLGDTMISQHRLTKGSDVQKKRSYLTAWMAIISITPTNNSLLPRSDRFKTWNQLHFARYCAGEIWLPEEDELLEPDGPAEAPLALQEAKPGARCQQGHKNASQREVLTTSGGAVRAGAISILRSGGRT